ncbi:Imm50 family immunity protein [Streptomyces sp. ST2-7A]|uniref:Imm50 family immunity protein n=1 Tax=Streptomyces sp. ST2-7A TaxID=2907214 RepID=UPI001F1CC70F|nr:Imm50 family immunity protein [Streptomyces sp. ST2-7A]MCE7083049.1 immunity 50 family protein [Streptomyces sp. ST2-7A]
MSWISVLDNPEGILRIYRNSPPSLRGVRIREFSMSRSGPTMRLLIGLSKFPDNPPMKWWREGFNRVLLDLHFVEVDDFSFTRFSPVSFCDFEMSKEGTVRFSAKSDSMDLHGVAYAAYVARISAYADTSTQRSP